MNKLYLLLLLSCLQSLTFAQVFTDSNLPIVVITTDNNAAIPDEPGVFANMKLIYRGPGQRNYLTDKDSTQFLNYDGRINIEIRGSYSQVFPKKAYGFTTFLPDDTESNDVSLMEMPAENDWILNGLSSDPSLIRDYLALNLSRRMGQYASRTAYCEVVVNGNYRGLYVLEEKIKPDKNRVNVHKIDVVDNNSPELSGGYITKTDKTTGGDPIAWYMSSYIGVNDNMFIHSWPKPEHVTAQQTSYLKSVFLTLQSACTGGNNSIVTGIPSMIDVPSFVDFMLLNEIAGNVDAYTYSTYYHKDRNAKLRAGPVWDLNLTFGNDLFQFGVARSKPNVWQFSDGGNEGPKYFRDMYNNPTFKCYMSRRWHELTQPDQPLNLDNLRNFIDSTAATISEAAVRENARWGAVGNFQFAVDTLKGWLKLRVPWMTTNIGAYSDCQQINTPPLVISRIHYHPDTSAAFPDEDKLEFLQITNAGSSDVDLTGVYFGGTGLVYQFPVGASLAPGDYLYIVSDTTTFRNRYGLTPFGQFTRNLSNSNQKLQLADAFGNEIDYVHYYDDAPWPDADGNGKFLQLISLSLDNSLASSWKAAKLNTLDAKSPASENAISVYPNPTSGQLQIHSEQNMESLEISDIQGKILARQAAAGNHFSMDLTPFPAGLYFLRINTKNGITMVKLQKN